MAKFKVGDKVTWSGHDGKEPGNYVVEEIRGNGYAIGEQGLPGWVAVVKEEKLKPGWISRNGVSMDEEYDSARARNAKFKVGDKVEITSGSKSGKLGTVESSAPGPMGGEMYHVRLEDGSLTDAAERNLLAANSAPLASTNSVVQNAINARRARNAIDFNGASAKVQKAFEGRIDKLVQKFKNDLSAVGTDVAKEYKKYQSIEPDSATLILEVGDWIESLKGSVDDSW